jgi:hypothetical protein
MGLFSDEGGQFVGGNGMSVDNRLKTAAGLSGLWDGSPVKRVRVGDGAIAGRRLSAYLMMQPDVSSIFLADPVLLHQGLHSRMLVAAPSSLLLMPLGDVEAAPEIIRMKQEGRGATEIAKTMGCSRRAIYKILAAAAA